MVTQDQQVQDAALDPRTAVGAVALTVADLDRSLDFYTAALGFTVQRREGNDAVLGVDERPLLLLRAEAGVRPAPELGTGLYHFAILLPTRADLGRWLQHFLATGYPMPGQGDHQVSEALYLSDPDGNGIEIYRDRPRDAWRWQDGRVRMASEPVDIDGLLAEAGKDDRAWQGFPAGTGLGHIHLRVGDIPQAERFYHGVLGFDIVANLPGALFVSAGGYHHHIGLNTWQSRGQGPAPAGTAGLRFFNLVFPDTEARAPVLARLAAAGISATPVGQELVVADPWHNVLLFSSGPLTVDAALSALGAVSDQVA